MNVKKSIAYQCYQNAELKPGANWPLILAKAVIQFKFYLLDKKNPGVKNRAHCTIGSVAPMHDESPDLKQYFMIQRNGLRKVIASVYQNVSSIFPVAGRIKAKQCLCVQDDKKSLACIN